MRQLEELPIDGKRVFVRVDFNVPIEDGNVRDDMRIRAAIPTLEALQKRDARIVLASHLGRPKGGEDPRFSMEPVAAKLAELWPHGEVLLAEDVDGDSAQKVAATVREGQLGIIQNLRFSPGEEANDDAFARRLAKLADVYVNDAFGAAHRAHASVAALPRLFVDRAAGLLLQKEVDVLDTLLHGAKKPYVAVLGGAKVSDKIGVIDTLLSKVDVLLIGGAMANTMLAAQGMRMGKSLVEENKLPLARSVMQKAESKGVRLLLPTDLVVADSFDASAGVVKLAGDLADHEMALDIGPATLSAYCDAVRSASTLFWNGPMGLFEREAFSAGTFGLAKTAAESSGFRVVGGGDSVAAVREAKLDHLFDHVSTGGGASLEYLEGKVLPGVEALS